jgi:anion-transporting  ArsA/GET3 family ATPase
LCHTILAFARDRRLAIVIGMDAKLSEFLKKKLLVITGKGGAGKSLLALALAHRLAASGKKVWLVELGRGREKAFSRLPSLVGKKELSHKPTEVKLPGTSERIHVSVLDPARCLAEYVDLKLPTGGLAGLLLGNSVTASFLEVVPGLPDLVAVGKLWHELAHPEKGQGFDVVVFDAPATGHAISLLSAPNNFRRITKVGPIFRDATLMTDFLANPEQTGIGLVTLPEEMSIQETLETEKILGKSFVAPLVFVNKLFPELKELEDQGKDSLPWKAYAYSQTRSERERETIKELGRQHKELVPYFFPEPEAEPLFLRISEALA